MNQLDANTIVESNYQFSQDQLQKDWELSKPQKCDDVVDYARKIMRGEVSKQEFNYTFNDFYQDDGEWEDGFQEALDVYSLGGVNSLNDKLLNSIVLAGLEGASQILFDTELDELSTWSQGEDNTNRMIKEVLNDN